MSENSNRKIYIEVVEDFEESDIIGAPIKDALKLLTNAKEFGDEQGYMNMYLEYRPHKGNMSLVLMGEIMEDEDEYKDRMRREAEEKRRKEFMERELYEKLKKKYG